MTGLGKLKLWNDRYRETSNLESIWSANCWATVGSLLENDSLANGMAKQIFLTVGQRGRTISQQLPNVGPLCATSVQNLQLKLLILNIRRLSITYGSNAKKKTPVTFIIVRDSVFLQSRRNRSIGSIVDAFFSKPP